MKSTTVNLDADKARGSRRDRLPWLDYAKGIGIVLVVVGHTLRGLMNAAVITETLPYEIADRWIYAFHMPLFFFLSGLLLPKSFAKNLTTVLGKKAKTILYPFLLWSFIQGAIQLALSNYTNGDFTGRNLLLAPFIPIQQFWFLYALFGITVICLLAAKLGIKGYQMLLISALIFFALPWVSLPHWTLSIILSNLIYVVAGIFVTASSGLALLNQGAQRVKGTLLGAIAIAAGSIIYASVRAVDQFNPLGELSLAALGIVMVLAVSLVLARRRAFSEIERYGQFSLEIFVAHTIASAGCRIILDKLLGIDAVFVHLLLGIVVGIYVPILLRQGVDRLGFKYMFVYP